MAELTHFIIWLTAGVIVCSRWFHPAAPRPIKRRNAGAV